MLLAAYWSNKSIGVQLLMGVVGVPQVGTPLSRNEGPTAAIQLAAVVIAGVCSRAPASGCK